MIGKIAKLGLNMAKIIVVEGVIAVAGNALREASKTNYKTIKEDIRQVVNLVKNRATGLEVEDWDML